MPRCASAVAFVVCLTLVHFRSCEVNARSLESADFEPRQQPNLLPAWLARLRQNLPSVFVTRTSTEVPVSTKPAEVLNWPSADLDVGQITGVATDTDSNPVIFHRGNVKWTGRSFDGFHRYQQAGQGPIPNDTIVTLDAATGKLLDHWGAGKFYMPHGLEIDSEGNVWVTDVALHQVFKFPKGSHEPSMTLGEAFVPGSDDNHFCQPSDVAVASTGAFFVSDGYCNQRILKFDAEGKVLGIYKGTFSIAHSLTLIEDADALCVADRENSRIVCLHAGLTEDAEFGTPYGSHGSKGKNIGRVYALAAKGRKMYAVIGSIFVGMAEGKTILLDNMEVKERWAPTKGFSNPHDVAISRDGESMYVVEIGPNRIVKFALE